MFPLVNPKLALRAARAAWNAADSIARLYGHADLAAYAHWAGRTEQAAETELLQPRCGVPDIQRAGVCKWSVKSLRVHWNLRGLPDWCDAAFADALPILEGLCGIKLARTNTRSQAHIWATAARIDGPGGTLAWSYLPCPEPKALPGLEQRYDAADSFLVASRGRFVRTVIHEIGHALGLDHNNDQRSFMFPTILTDSVSIPLTDPAAVGLIGRYGPSPVPELPTPGFPTPPPAPPTPPGPAPTPRPTMEVESGRSAFQFYSAPVTLPNGETWEGELHFLARRKPAPGTAPGGLARSDTGS
jgi:hypothetical protein